MANLRWWLLLIAAVMFSMSGCTSARTAWQADAGPGTVDPLVGTFRGDAAPVVITLARQAGSVQGYLRAPHLDQ
jgi:hypothetical protein